MIASKEAMAVLFVIVAAGTWGLTGVLSKYLLGTTAPMIVVLIQLGSSVLVSWVIVVIKFEEVEIEGKFLVASALGVLHPGLSTTLGIVGLVHLDASISSTIWVAKIRKLNDRLRKYGHGGMWLATIGISSLPPDDMRSVYEAVLTFDDFTPDNDPHGEHDCAVQNVGDLKIIWKIDYYDRDRQFLSPDPSDPKVTVRVLTVMLASEY